MPVEFKSQGWMLRLRSENMDPSLCSGISPICRSTVTDQGDKSCYFEQCSWDQEVCRLPGWLCHIKDTVVMHSEECCYFLFLPGSRRNQCQPHKYVLVCKLLRGPLLLHPLIPYVLETLLKAKKDSAF